MVYLPYNWRQEFRERIDYLADVRKPGEAKQAVADADFVPKP